MLFLLMIVLPFVELSLLLSVGERIGAGWTLVSVILTGIVGAQLARREGLRTMLALQKEVQTGAMPGRLLVGSRHFREWNSLDDAWNSHRFYGIFRPCSVDTRALGRAGFSVGSSCCCRGEVCGPSGRDERRLSNERFI